MIELNVNAVGPDGQPVANPIIELQIYDATGKPCSIQPFLRPQANFYAGNPVFAPGGTIGPYSLYGTAQAPGYSTAFFGWLPIQWDGRSTLNITVPLSFKTPFRTMPLFWKANMCGIRIPGLPPVPGGAADPELFLSWFYHLYDAGWRAIIRAAMKARGLTHWLTSWPDAQDAGVSPDEFAALNRELIVAGFFPCPFLSAKPTNSSNVRSVPETLANIQAVLPALFAAKVPGLCLGWELSLWLTPQDVQWLTDQLYIPILQTQARFYVHFQEGYPSYQPDGGTVADYWRVNVGKLTGLLYQKKLDQNDAQFLDSISDNLQRFCGGFNMPSHSGVQDGPFTWTALELDAQWQFNGRDSEAEGNRLGQLAINAPHCFGPDGTEAFVNGAGNGI